MTDIEELARLAIDHGFGIHKEIGPGLLESAYESLLAASLAREGLSVERQKAVSVHCRGVNLIDAFRIDLMIDGRLIIEVKSVERFAPIHAKQLLTYLRLTEQPLGLLMNFGGITFREDLRRIVNNHAFASSRLRVNQSEAALREAHDEL
jgi:GxxExxY protein